MTCKAGTPPRQKTMWALNALSNQESNSVPLDYESDDLAIKETHPLSCAYAYT
jgi:hypothetical protein